MFILLFYFSAVGALFLELLWTRNPLLCMTMYLYNNTTPLTYIIQ